MEPAITARIGIDIPIPIPISISISMDACMTMTMGADASAADVRSRCRKHKHKHRCGSRTVSARIMEGVCGKRTSGNDEAIHCGIICGHGSNHGRGHDDSGRHGPRCDFDRTRMQSKDGKDMCASPAIGKA